MQPNNRPASALTNAEVLATFMEPRPDFLPYSWQSPINWGDSSPARWWLAMSPDAANTVHGIWKPRQITLNECREIEAGLTEEQWVRYWRELMQLIWEASEKRGEHALANMTMTRGDLYRHLVHADAPTKVEALATILRPLVAS